jgi:predicted DNA-binding transcriptional regulator AlpA
MTFTDAQPSPALSPEAVLTFHQWCELVGVGGEQDRVMNFKEWVKAASISEKCGRYLIENGDAPPIVQLSPNRIGIRVCDHRAWLASRIRRERRPA